MLKRIVYLATQVSHVHVYNVGIGVEVLVPDVLQQLPSRQHLIVMAYKILQQPELFLAQLCRNALTRCPV